MPIDTIDLLKIFDKLIEESMGSPEWIAFPSRKSAEKYLRMFDVSEDMIEFHGECPVIICPKGKGKELGLGNDCKD